MELSLVYKPTEEAEAGGLHLLHYGVSGRPVWKTQ